MEDLVVFRNFQEQTADDHNNVQKFARQSFDDLVNDAVTNSPRYSGLNTLKTNQAEVTVAPGRFYGKNVLGKVGAVFTQASSLAISMVAYLPVSTSKFVLLCASGVENLTDNQTRDFLINVTTGQTQPQAVPMQSSRDLVINIVPGAESATPQLPAVPADMVAVASVLLNSTGVVSVGMMTAGQVRSTENLDGRVLVIEDFDAQIGPRVTALASDLADLALRVRGQFDRSLLLEITADIARLKAKDGLPQAAAQYGASYLLWDDPTFDDSNNSQSLGWHALVEYGVRFPAQNANLFTLSLFNSLDPNLAYAGNGLLLPAYDHVKKLSTAGNLAAPTDSLLIGQYGYQNFTTKQIDIPYMRIRSGGTYYTCSNGNSGWLNQPDGSVSPWWLPNFSTYQVQSGAGNTFDAHNVATKDYLWVDTWTQPFWALESVPASISGALVSQTFLVSNDTWMTKLGIWITTKASNTDITLTLCQTTNGAPDLTKTLYKGTLTGASLTVGMNYLTMTPTFAAKGDRLALVITSAANHGIGLAPAGSYLNGSFFYSIDGAYFLGDFTKEMFLEVWGAQFRSSQTLAEFSPLSLLGGIRALDVTVRAQIPASCDIVYEVMPDGTSTWIPISVEAPLAPFTGAPVLARFRARLIGTPDIAPGIVLPDSICKIWAPGPQFKFVSESQVLSAPSTTLTVQYVVENFDLVAHTFTPKVYTGSPLTVRNPTAVTTELMDATRKRYKITASFTVPSTSAFTIFAQGDTNSITNVFHIASLLWWSI